MGWKCVVVIAELDASTGALAIERCKDVSGNRLKVPPSCEGRVWVVGVGFLCPRKHLF